MWEKNIREKSENSHEYTKMFFQSFWSLNEKGVKKALRNARTR